MKVNRRSFFAAAASAPVAVKEAVSVLAKEQSISVLGGFASAPIAHGIGGIPSSAPSDWMQSELKDLLGRRKRVSAEAAKPELNLSAAVRIDGLRSISAAVRARMIAEDRARRSRENELAWMDRQIAEFKEKLGPLGALFE